MPWRLPVGLDALLPSCRACKAAALLVWHRHAGPHRRDPLRRSHAPSTSLHRVAVSCSTPSPRHAPTPALRCRSISFCGASSLPFADVPPSCLHFAPPGLPPFPSTGCLRFAPRGNLHSAPRGHLHSAPRGRLRFAPRGRLHSAPRGRLHFAPRARRRPENSRFEASFSVSGRRASTKM